MNDCAMPKLIHDLASVIGDYDAIKLASANIGKRIRIPVNPNHDHPIAKVIGIVNARKLAEHYKLEIIEFPMMRRGEVAVRHACIQADSKTMTHAQLAEKWRLSRRQIINILNKVKKESHAHANQK